MFKIMNRSLLYYIKRPIFSTFLFFSDYPERIYSLFVMDLIESNNIVIKDYSGRYCIKVSSDNIDMSLTNIWVKIKLEDLYKKNLREIKKSRAESKIKEHLNVLKGENTTK